MLYWEEREVAYLFNTFAHPVENVLIGNWKAACLSWGVNARRFCSENVSAVLQRWATSNWQHCVPIVFILISSKWANFHPSNHSNVYNSQARRQDFAARAFIQYNIECMQQTPRKKSLETCKLQENLTRPRKFYRCGRRTGRAPSFVLLQLGRDIAEETRNSRFWKSLKLLSPCRLSLRFTFVPRLLCHVAQATAYQAVHYTAEIKQKDQWFSNFHEPGSPSKESGEYLIHRDTWVMKYHGKATEWTPLLVAHKGVEGPIWETLK